MQIKCNKRLHVELTCFDKRALNSLTVTFLLIPLPHSNFPIK